MGKVVSFYDEKLSISIPEEFERLHTEQIKNYFNNSQPEFAYAYEDKRAVITITKPDIELSENNLEDRLVEYYNIYQRSVANFSNGNMAKKLCNSGKKIGMFHYTSTSVERDLLNFFCLLSLDDKEVMVTLHCAILDSPELGKKFMDVINSIDIMTL